MRTIERSTLFKRDYKREAKGRFRATLEKELIEIVIILAFDKEPPEKYRDHGLSGDWSGYRECHIKPDLLLIYKKHQAETLRLARLGSHSELGL